MNNKEAIEFLKNMIDQKAVTLIDNDFTARYHIDALQMAIEALKNERPHDKWIRFKTDNTTIQCPFCTAFVSAFRTRVFKDKIGNFNYCPNCGADLREATDNEC